MGNVYKTVRTRFNLEAVASKFITAGVNFQFSERNESSVPVSLSDLIHTTPWGSYYAADGVTLRVSPNDDPGNNTHPFIPQRYTDRMYKYDDIFGSVYAKGQLPFGFSYQINYTPRYDLMKRYNHQSASNPVIAARKGIVDRDNASVFSWQLDNVFRWRGTFGKHSIEATFLVNAEKFKSDTTFVHAENFSPNDNLSYNNIGAGTLPPIISSNDQYATGDALMGRINYSYNDRYLLTLTARRDGYSAFGQQNPRATFPSVALAWSVSEEKFLRKASRWLDFAKVRVSYGENGNREIGRYAALSNLTSGTYVYVTSGGVTYNVAQLAASNLSNPALKWERNASVNVGLDYSALKGRVSGSLDYYTRATKDLLVNRTLPTVTGFTNILANLGEVQNKGFELSLTGLNMRSKLLEWRSTVSFWLNRNKIVHMYGPTPDCDANGKQIGTSEKNDIANGWFIGKPINAVYDYGIPAYGRLPMRRWQKPTAINPATSGWKMPTTTANTPLPIKSFWATRRRIFPGTCATNSGC